MFLDNNEWVEWLYLLCDFSWLILLFVSSFFHIAPNFQIELLYVEKNPTKSDNLFSIQNLYAFAFACANFRFETLAQPK
jgi:hypothetical protein